MLGAEGREGRARRPAAGRPSGRAAGQAGRGRRRGQQIDPAAARLVAERAGTDIATLRGDVERLLLYAAGKPKITLADVQESSAPKSSQDDWAVTNAIQRGNAPEALRAARRWRSESGAVPYMILGQLAWFVREKLGMADPRRMPAAVEALFRTDLDLKSSGGDPRVLLERLVVELCGCCGRSPAVTTNGPSAARRRDFRATRAARRDL